MSASVTTSNPGIDSVTFGNIAVGSPFVRASDGRELYKAEVNLAIDIETESIVSVGDTEAVYAATASGTVEFVRIGL